MVIRKTRDILLAILLVAAVLYFAAMAVRILDDYTIRHGWTDNDWEHPQS